MWTWSNYDEKFGGKWEGLKVPIIFLKFNDRTSHVQGTASTWSTSAYTVSDVTSRHSAASQIRQSTTPCSSATPAANVRPTGFLCCWFIDLALSGNLRDPSVSRDSFRRLMKTYLFTLYWTTQRIRGCTRICYTNLYLGLIIQICKRRLLGAKKLGALTAFWGQVETCGRFQHPVPCIIIRL